MTAPRRYVGTGEGPEASGPGGDRGAPEGAPGPDQSFQFRTSSENAQAQVRAGRPGHRVGSPETEPARGEGGCRSQGCRAGRR